MFSMLSVTSPFGIVYWSSMRMAASNCGTNLWSRTYSMGPILDSVYVLDQ